MCKTCVETGMTCRLFPVLCVLLGLVAVPTVVLANGGGGVAAAAAAAATISSSRGLETRALRNFRSFLLQNPEIAGALKADPALVRDSGFRGAHPELQSYLATHRPFARRIEKRPRLVMNQIAKLKH